MDKNKEMKPLKMRWIWILYGLLVMCGLFFNWNPEVVANWLLWALFLSILIYSFNVKKFGKKYWKHSKV